MEKILPALQLVVAVCLFFTPAAKSQTNHPPTSSNATVVDAGKKFLGTLNDAQYAKVLFLFTDEAQRKHWSNFPSGIFQREGLRLGDLQKPQRDAAMALVSAALSPQGYEKISQIIQGDEVLKQQEGGRLIFGKDEYYISLLGEPSTTNAWMLQFGGHHLAINITFAGDKSTLAPSHTGAQPAIYQIEGKSIRPLGRENDKAFALLASLDDHQRKQAVLGFQMRDMVLGPGRDGQTIQPEGIKGSALTEKQRGLLLDIAAEWTGIQNESAAKAKLREMGQNIEQTWFAWSGPTEKNSAAYFRIQGPTVFIEYAPQRMGGDATKHIHTIYRDPSNDYGAKWWKR